MKLKTDKVVLHSEVVKVIYQRLEWTIDNIKDNFPGEKLTLSSLQKKLDRGSVEPDVLHIIAQDCACLLQLRGVLDALNIDLKLRKQKFEQKVYLWGVMVS